MFRNKFPNQFFTILGLFLFLPSILLGQLAEIIGKIIEYESEHKLAGSNITLLEIKFGAAADTNGCYRINNIPPGTYMIQAARIGYKSRQIKIILQAGESKVIDFALQLQPVPVKAIQVEAKRLAEKYDTPVSLVGVRRMQRSQLSGTPGAFEDPARAVQLFSGIMNASDYSSLIAIRGSSPDQNLFIFDGAIVPNPYRLRLAMGGGMSILDSYTIEAIHLHLGGFSAEYGNKLSSVLEVDSREGNRQRLSGRGSINVMDAGAALEGPLPKRKGSWLVSARRTYFDFIADRFAGSSSVFPFTYDLKTRIIFEPDSRHRIGFNVLHCEEQAELLRDLSESFNLVESAANQIFSLSWKYQVSRQLQSTTILSVGKDDFKLKIFKPDTALPAAEYEQQHSHSHFSAFKWDMRYTISTENHLTGGFYYSQNSTDVRLQSRERNFFYARSELPTFLAFDRKEKYWAGYLEYHAAVTEKFQIRTGLRFDYSKLIENGEFSPRLGLWYQLNPVTNFFASWGVSYQYPDLLTSLTREQPLDFSGDLTHLTAEKATHTTIGLKRNRQPNYF